MALNQIGTFRKRLARADLPATERHLQQLIYQHHRSRAGACQQHLVDLAEEIEWTPRPAFRLIREPSHRGYLEFESTGRRRRNGLSHREAINSATMASVAWPEIHLPVHWPRALKIRP